MTQRWRFLQPAKISDIADDTNLSAEAQEAVSQRHAMGTGAVLAVTTSNQVIPANSSAYVIDQYEVGSGFVTEIGSGAFLEIG